MTETYVKRAGAVNEALEAIKQVNAKACADILSGALAVTEKALLALVRAGKIGDALSNLRNGRKWNDSGYL